MTKKDYVAVAAAINAQVRVTLPNNPTAQATRDQALWDVAEQLIVVFRRENDRFDRARFLAACGLNGGQS